MTRIFHGEIQGDPSRPAKSITSRDLDPDVDIGDLVARWDHYFTWDEFCVKGKDLEKLRLVGDDLCDDVVRFLGMGRGDLLAKLEKYASSTPREEWDPCVERFWASVEGPPRERVDTSHGVYVPNFDRSSPQGTLSRGQEVFWRYISPIMTSLLHFSLVGGFSAPKVIEVLLHTSYLTSSSSALTNRRLFETTQMILDAMTDLTPSSGIGFRSILRVRMLHSQVRIRLLLSNKYDTEYFGIPINQEDLLATLGAFSVACIWSMERMKIYISQQDRESYIAVWKHIGYYMGIQPAYLNRHYSSFRAAEKFLLSTIAHLLEPVEGKPSGMLPLQLLNGIANRPLYGGSLEYHAELSRFFVGDSIADVFQLPRGNLESRVRLWFNITVIRLELWFGRWYFGHWERERIRLMKEFVNWLVMWQVGKRQAFERTEFGYKVGVQEEGSQVTSVDAKGGAKVNNEMESNEKEQENENDGNVRVHVDRAYIKALKRRYYTVIIAEPLLLVGGTSLILGCIVWNWKTF